ncbi:Gfo/Idh/MocA family protein [Olivibacter sp. XZL3]|uniref:Gfo/Idh/MocA family protein n=1 Tax=Olivibacter sp. XZL3 TaxID=1735116 RepID=UPI001065F440|nr:Gfo/Idh/MocA family oxidoreductase [Olivibacter sp. XZL3]
MSLNRRTFMQQAALLGFYAVASKPWIKAIRQTVDGKRIGIIGLDTSHSIAFTKALNAANADPIYKGFHIVAAYPYGSKTIASSANRIPAYIEEVKGMGVEILPSICTLCEAVDYILLETNDGRLHWEQAKEVIDLGKTLFIDKPLAASYMDGSRILAYAKQKGVPVFSASSLRWADGIGELHENRKIGDVKGADTFSPSPLEPTHPDLFWYGIHGVEMLYAILGAGCTEVSRITTATTDIVVGKWPNECVGTFRGMREGNAFGGIAFGEKGVQLIGGYKGYNQLLQQIVNFFETGIAPVSDQEMQEVLAFMEAADLSKSENGQAVSLAEVLKR